MKKSISFFAILFVLLFNLNAQGIKVGVLNGPSCIPVAYMLEKNQIINEIPVSYEKCNDIQGLLPKMIKKEVDIGFMPANVASKVYASSNKAIICCAVTGNGNLVLITKDKNVKRFADLKNKTISVAGQGATPEYVFKYLLDKNELKIDSKNKNDVSVSLSFSTPTPQIVPQLLSDKISYAVVPEPFATIARLKSKDVVYGINLQSEYEFFTGKKDYPLTLMVVRREFAENNKEILQLFLSAYEEAYKWTIENPTASGRLCEKYELGLEAGVVAAAIPNSNFTYLPSNEAKDSIEEILKIFMTFAPEAIGNKLPDENFYFGYKESAENQEIEALNITEP